MGLDPIRSTIPLNETALLCDAKPCDDNGSAAQVPLYATLFPAATAWHKAEAFFGDFGNSLVAALFTGFATQGSFDLQRANEPWLSQNLSRDLLRLTAALEATGVVRDRFLNGFRVDVLKLLAPKDMGWRSAAAIDAGIERFNRIARESGDPRAILFSNLIAIRWHMGKLSLWDAAQFVSVSYPEIVDTTERIKAAVQAITALESPEALPYRLWLERRMKMDIQSWSAPFTMEWVVPSLRAAWSSGPERISSLHAFHIVREGEVPVVAEAGPELDYREPALVRALSAPSSLGRLYEVLERAPRRETTPENFRHFELAHQWNRRPALFSLSLERQLQILCRDEKNREAFLRGLRAGTWTVEETALELLEAHMREVTIHAQLDSRMTWNVSTLGPKARVLILAKMVELKSLREEKAHPRGQYAAERDRAEAKRRFFGSEGGRR